MDTERERERYHPEQLAKFIVDARAGLALVEAAFDHHTLATH
jgi:hypothetical protein